MTITYTAKNCILDGREVKDDRRAFALMLKRALGMGRK